MFSNRQGSCDPFLGDVWSLGTVLYEMITGIQCPFRSQDRLSGGVESLHGFNEVRQTDEMVEALSFLRLCLEVDPSKRITSTDLGRLFNVYS